jgi:hypothetical protein
MRFPLLPVLGYRGSGIGGGGYNGGNPNMVGNTGRGMGGPGMGGVGGGMGGVGGGMPPLMAQTKQQQGQAPYGSRGGGIFG